MTDKRNLMLLCLQLFSENGADGGTGAEGNTAESGIASTLPKIKGAKENALANVKYGKQEESVSDADLQEISDENAAVDRNAKFEELIKGEYKDLYDARVQETIQKRFKSNRETNDKLKALSPILERLSEKYGVDAGDAEALKKAIDEDDSYYEQEALERGMSVEELKYIKSIERENADFKKAMKEIQDREDADKLYASWIQQAEKTKQVYPTFDLENELQNNNFVDLLRSGVDVQTAYQVVHINEVLPAAMQFAARATEKKVANKIAANGARPVENGLNNSAAAVTKSDVSQLTKDDMAEINRRVARGERIVF